MKPSLLIPNVSRLPSSADVERTNRIRPSSKDGVPGEFDNLLNKVQTGIKPEETDLHQIRVPLKFSSHALQRMQDRKIQLEPETMARVNDALDKVAAKGVEDTLVLTKDAALIVSVKNRTVITAMDRNALEGNVFTNIDGAVIV